jgi:hypothetical protein
MHRQISWVIAIVLLTGCDRELNSKHQRGDCVAADDGFMWFITNVEESSYTARGRFGSRWGTPTHIARERLDKYELILCDVTQENMPYYPSQ